MSTAFLSSFLRCWQSSPRNYEVLETLAEPSRQLQTRTETSRPSLDTACRIHGSVAGRFRARFPAGSKRQKEEMWGCRSGYEDPNKWRVVAVKRCQRFNRSLVLCELGFSWPVMQAFVPRPNTTLNVLSKWNIPSKEAKCSHERGWNLST